MLFVVVVVVDVVVHVIAPVTAIVAATAAADHLIHVTPCYNDKRFVKKCVLQRRAT
jgi:NAD(P)H-dependent FMN reductase